MARNKFGLSDGEFAFFRSLNSPEKIQDYIDENLKYNFCGGDYPKPYICKSPRRVLEEGTAHCFEGALFAAAALRINHRKPLVLGLDGLKNDDHVLALFKRKGYIGVVAQSQHYIHNWRDPIFRNTRELALTFFPGYTLGGIITIRTYSDIVNLSQFDSMNWISTDNSLEELGNIIDTFPTHSLVPKNLKLRKVPVELEELTKKHKPLTP